MARRSCLALMGVILSIVLVVPPAQAQWAKNGTVMCTEPGNQIYPTIASDGAGGAIVTWMDHRGASWQVYAQRVNASGAVQWTTDGVALSVATDDQNFPTIISDGAGGAIVTWYEFRSSYAHIYAQRVNGAGAVQWTANGVALCEASGYQENPTIISDGAGGAIVTWWDHRSGTNFDIYAQKVDASGSVQWTTNGVALCTATGDQDTPTIASDGAGGAIVTWQDNRSGSDHDVYAQRVNASGAVQWTTDGVALCTAPGEQMYPTIASDGAGGAIVPWENVRNGFDSEIYAQRVDASGAVLWTVDGVALSTATTNPQQLPQITSDGAGGAIVAWDGGGIFAQRIDGDGKSLWFPEGVLALPFSRANNVRVIADGHGGAIVAVDGFVGSNWAHIYAQRLDPAGNLLWAPPLGVGVCTSPLNQYAPDLITDGLGGAIVAWENETALGDFDIYSQRVGPEGLWGDPEPAIISSLDLPNDQGGWVRLKTRASSHDIQLETDYPIVGYNVWRRIDEKGKAGSAVDRAGLLKLFADPKQLAGIKLSNDQAHVLGFPPGAWESVASQFATRDTAYNIAAPTRNDSTSSGIPSEIYLVTAHTSTAGVFVTSEPHPGYSVDNLAPGVTSGFAGEQSLSPAGLELTWNKNDAPDLWKYDVHRGNLETFEPGPSNLIGTTEGTEFLDPTWMSFYHYFYKLVAVDRHENQSASALLRPEDIKVGTLLQTFAASLKDAAIKISWTLSEAGVGASFYVLRAEGSGELAEFPGAAVERNGLSFTCIDGTCEPGTTYRYRVDVEDESGRRSLFETDAISTPVLPLTLYQNHPNPFNPSTVIGFYVPVAAQVTLDIYDSSGKLVSRLIDRAQRSKGTHQIDWRGIDARGKAVSSGVYFYRLTAGKETISRKMILMR